MFVQNNRPITDVAQELVISPGALGIWVNEYLRGTAEQDEPLPASERIRLSELESEVRRLRMENEFLNSVDVWMDVLVSAVSGLDRRCAPRPRPG